MWPLGVYHELIQKRILIKPGGGLQKSRPSTGLPQLHRRMVGHISIQFVFRVYRMVPPFLLIRLINTIGLADGGNILAF